ncbi:MAG: cytochrome c oxidase accessory protein CcoG [Opitutaceae bacterium]|nr:cytochrome c oxidase accessory protein CcoG [Opitutaceae bacterium]
MSALRPERPNRDTVTTIRKDGSKAFLFPADVRGRFEKYRKLSASALIVFYLALPWIKINGYPAVFLDIAGRRFHLFGVTLAAQDLWLLFFVITGLGFTLFFITALLGRVWCGWACPHTVFLDHVYRKIERWIDGDAVKRRALDQAPWTTEKIIRRVVKHTLYILVSAIITHLFLAYFVSLPEVWSMMRTAPTEHWGAFLFMGLATGALYFNFAWFREQMCIVLCPYGRIQSALIDDHSLVIGYDTKRGEPRSSRKSAASRREDGAAALKSAAPLAETTATAEPAGDCVDCLRCVQVCPTGIDIRQGLQMECIGCTACIDACDAVMTRLGRPEGLIRYDSQQGFTGKPTRWLRSRTILYLALFMVGAGVALWALSTVKPMNLDVTRMTGAPYVVDAQTVRNQFLVRLLNKQNRPAHFNVRIVGGPEGLKQVGLETTVEVPPLAELVQPLILQQARDRYEGLFRFEVEADGVETSARLARRVDFLGPEARLLREEEAEKHHGKN